MKRKAATLILAVALTMIPALNIHASSLPAGETSATNQSPQNPAANYSGNTNSSSYNQYYSGQNYGPGYVPYGTPYANHGQQMQQPYANYGQQMQQPYANYGQQMQQPYANYGQQVQQPYASYGQQMQQPYANYGYNEFPTLRSGVSGHGISLQGGIPVSIEDNQSNSSVYLYQENDELWLMLGNIRARLDTMIYTAPRDSSSSGSEQLNDHDTNEKNNLQTE